MLFNDIRRNQKLAERRSPMFDKNRFAKFLIYFTVAFWAAYLVFVGVMLYLAFKEQIPHMEPYHVLNQILLVFLVLDFLIRLMIPTPLQEIKPYLLLPVLKRKVLDTLLVQHGLKLYNLIWLFLFVPFACLAVFRFYGVAGVAGYAVGIWLLMVANGYWSMLVKTLMRVHFAWLALVVPVYGLLALLEFLPDTHWVSTFTMNLGEGYILWNPVAIIGTCVAIVLLAGVNRRVQLRLIYDELSRTEDSRVRRISSYAFLDRYGRIGEFMRLELKMIFRNSITRRQFWSFVVLIVLFVAMLSFFPKEAMEGNHSLIGSDFFCMYCYGIVGLMSLVQVMSTEGNYIDGLMVRRDTIHSLLCAKYYVFCVLLFLPFALMLVPVFRGRISLLESVAYWFFTMGFSACCLLQLAAFNNKTMSLNAKMMGKQGNSSYQFVMSLVVLFLPLLLYKALAVCFGLTATYLILSGGGLLLMATHRLWLKGICRRFMARRYANLEGFRNTR